MLGVVGRGKKGVQRPSCRHVHGAQGGGQGRAGQGRAWHGQTGGPTRQRFAISAMRTSMPSVDVVICKNRSAMMQSTAGHAAGCKTRERMGPV